MQTAPTEQRHEKIQVFRGNEYGFPSLSVGTQLSALIERDIDDHHGNGKPATLLPKSPLVLINQFMTGRNVIMMDDRGEIVGFAAFYELAVIHGVHHWELGTVVVRPEMRGQGIGRRLYAEVEALHQSLGGVLYGTTKSERVVQIGRYHGLEPLRFDCLDTPVRQAICYDAPCFSPTIDAADTCKRQHDSGGDCWLRSRAVRS